MAVTMKNGVFWDVTPCGSPFNIQAVMSTLIHRARALCDEDSLQTELLFLKDVFKENGYNDR
jgi:hypothetical protein